MTRKAIPLSGSKAGRLGRRGQYVRAFIELDLARVLIVERGRRRVESWPNTPAGRAEAKGYAEGTYERFMQKRPADIPPITLRAMWEAYWLAEYAGLRTKTQINYRDRWKPFETFAGRDAYAHTITPARLDEYRKALTDLGRAINQVGLLISAVKRVFRWAIHRDLVPPNKITEYRFKVKRGEKRIEMVEYRTEDQFKILAQWSPRGARTWRPYVATVLFAYQGPRKSAAFAMEWDDVDLVKNRIRWRAETDKIGNARWQPMPAPVVEAMWIAYGWRIAIGYTGPYVFPGATSATRGVLRELKAWEQLEKNRRVVKKPRAIADKPWSYSAYIAQLRLAEQKAGVPYIKYRGAHGWRRMAAGNVLEMTGNADLAMKWIGDKDPRIMSRYLKEREDQMSGVAARLGMPEPSSQTATESLRDSAEPKTVEVKA